MTWTSGWWSGASKAHLHTARMGGTILPFSRVIHTTDIHPDSWGALLASWATSPGKGNAAHFGIGRTEREGVVQWVPINRNSNHAGGSSHGVYQVGIATLHPNLVSVGIEVHNAGQLRLVDGAWRFGEIGGVGKNWINIGSPIPTEDVEPDPDRPDKGWHKPTQYQLTMLDRLCVDLEDVMQPMPASTEVRSGGREKPPSWAKPRTARQVGHVSLDPERRSDPWPLIMRHINKE